jgi:hypothetical protein
MRRWLPSGVVLMVLGLMLIMVRTARLAGVTSPTFWWSMAICVAVAAIALALRWWWYGPHLKHQQRAGLN